MTKKSRMLTVFVAVDITTSSKTHCSNDCRFMTTFSRGVCSLAGDYETVELEWDRRKKLHGYKRTKVCMSAELKRRPIHP